MIKKGFTLVELLVVIAVFGAILTALLVLVNPIDQIQKANDARRKHDLEQIKNALELYYNDNGEYPEATSDGSISGGAWGTKWSNYMDKVPDDPDESRKYVYETSLPVRNYFFLYASLERGEKDAQACHPGDNGEYGQCENVYPPDTTFCGISSTYICDYGVSSSNSHP